MSFGLSLLAILILPFFAVLCVAAPLGLMIYRWPEQEPSWALAFALPGVAVAAAGTIGLASALSLWTLSGALQQTGTNPMLSAVAVAAAGVLTFAVPTAALFALLGALGYLIPVLRAKAPWLPGAGIAALVYLAILIVSCAGPIYFAMTMAAQG